MLTDQRYSNVVIILTDNAGNTHIVDLLKLAGEQSLTANNITDWASLAYFLSSFDLLNNYKTTTVVPTTMQTYGPIINGVQSFRYVDPPIHNTTTQQLNIFSLENEFGVNVEFCNKTNMDTALKDAMWYNMPDLLFTKTKSRAVNFANTLPFVNGAACYPKMWGDKLIAYNARTVLDRTTEYNKNIVLVDFSPYGTLHTTPLNQCTDVRITHEQMDTTTHLPFNAITYNTQFEIASEQQRAQTGVVPNTHIRIEFTTPASTPQTFPMLAIGGSLFLPSEKLRMTRVGNKYRVVFNTTRDQILRIIHAGLQRIGSTGNNTQLTTPNITQFLSTLFATRPLVAPQIEGLDTGVYYANTFDPFFCTISPVSQLVITETEAQMVLPQYVLFDKVRAGGLLMNKYTGEVLDYVRANYLTNTGAYPVETKPLKILLPQYPSLDRSGIGYRTNNHVAIDTYNSFNLHDDIRSLDKYVLIDIIRRPT